MASEPLVAQVEATRAVELLYRSFRAVFVFLPDAKHASSACLRYVTLNPKP